MAIVFVMGFLFVKNILPSSAAEETDKTPPAISNIRITETTSTSTEIRWETDEYADSMVRFGLDKRYGIARDPRADKTEHNILLDDLLPGKNYYFRVISTDEYGNQRISNDFNVVTGESEDDAGWNANILDTGVGGLKEKILEEGRQGLSEETLEDVVNLIDELSSAKSLNEGYEEGRSGDEQENIMDEILESVGKITSEGDLKEIQEKVKQRAEEIVEPPTIILDLANIEVGIDYAIISWSTDKESDSIVALADEEDYNPDAEDPYTWKEGEPDELVIGHVVEINGLSPSTVYHFQVASTDEIGLTGKSTDKTFKTKAVAPEIYNARMYKIEEEAATIRWSTNVPCSSIIEYTNLNTTETKLEGNSSYLTVHSIKLSNLTFDTYYSAIIRVESESGEKTEHIPMTFITTKDDYPPEISKVNTESTIYPGSENRIQTIASWRTDEPGKCQLFYHQGLISAEESHSLPLEEDFGLDHVEVITNFLPASVYKYWIVCEDEAGNSKKSEDFTMLTPTREESIIDIIIKNFEQQFSWLKRK